MIPVRSAIGAVTDTSKTDFRKTTIQDKRKQQVGDIACFFAGLTKEFVHWKLNST
jgi:hypothetical protein